MTMDRADWEGKYHQLYNRLIDLERRAAEQEGNWKEKLDGAEEKVSSALEQLSEKDEALRLLGRDLKLSRDRESGCLSERSRNLSKICELECTLKEERDCWTRRLEETLVAKRNLKGSVGRLREQVAKKDELLASLRREAQLVREERDGLRDALSDAKEGRFQPGVKVASNTDLLLKKYVETFPQDESDITFKFVDRASQHSSLAFRLLLQLCHEDATSNVRLLSRILPTVDSMVEVVVHGKLFVDMCRYARIAQCKNAGSSPLF